MRKGHLRPDRRVLLAGLALAAAGVAVRSARARRARTAPPWPLPVRAVPVRPEPVRPRPPEPEPPPPEPVEPPTAAVVAVEPDHAAVAPRRSRRRRLTFLAAVVLACVGAAVAYAFRDVGDRPTLLPGASTIAARLPPPISAPATATTSATTVPSSTARATTTRATITPAVTRASTAATTSATTVPSSTARATTTAAATAASTAATTAAAPPPHPTVKPPQGFVPSRTFIWPPRAGATGYLVTFVHDGAVVLRSATKGPRLELPSSFAFQAGRYRWTVWALPRGAQDRPVSDSQFVLTAAAAAATNSGR